MPQHPSKQGVPASRSVGECSCNEDASATGLLDSLLSGLGEELGLDDEGDLGEAALAEDLEKALREEMI